MKEENGRPREEKLIYYHVKQKSTEEVSPSFNNKTINYTYKYDKNIMIAIRVQQGR